MSIESFEQLEVWQVAHRLVLQVYRVTGTMPSDQRYVLISQMQRAVVSTPPNIAEGFKRRGRLDKAQLYNIAQGSLEELRCYLIWCGDLGYKLDYNSPAAQADKVGRMLTGLIKAVRAGSRPFAG